MTPELRRVLGARRSAVSHLIRHELRLRGKTGARLAEEIGCSEPNVSKTINGLSHSEPVLKALRELGVPEKYLFDPHTWPVAEAGSTHPERMYA